MKSMRFRDTASPFKRGFVCGCACTALASIVLGAFLPNADAVEGGTDGTQAARQQIPSSHAMAANPSRAPGEPAEAPLATGRRRAATIDRGQADVRNQTDWDQGLEAVDGSEVHGRNLGLGELEKVRRHNARVVGRANKLLQLLNGD
ncbi:MAG: hypothetical protein OXU20_31115 [Myxococcales bacterium]|nr:hypothetical protein [Myxococcales bacterium]